MLVCVLQSIFVLVFPPQNLGASYSIENTVTESGAIIAKKTGANACLN